MATSIQYIDIHKVLMDSKSNFLKSLPKFIVALLKIIIKENEINRILSLYADCKGKDFLPKILFELNIKAEIEGLENLPDNGRCFFVANHPFGFVDGLILTNLIAEKYGDFKAIGNEVFMLIPHVRPIIAAVNVFGINPRNYLLELNKIFASDLPITHFPAGSVSRVKKCKIVDSAWQKSFITKAIEYQRNVVPVYFYGRNSRFFYILYLIRKMLGINTNIEMALLSREMFNKMNKSVKVKIGKPISYETFNNSKTHFEWAQVVKHHVYNLGG